MMSSDANLKQRKPKASAQEIATTPKTPTVPADYNRPVFKLGIVSISMAILPIATYYGTLGRVFEETNTTAAAISAIVVTNVILIGYILMALLEKDDDQAKLDERRKKDS